MNNPFRYGSVVTDKQFCGRKSDIIQLKDFIATGQNVVLQGERRIGKTSLVLETMRQSASHRLLMVNLMEVKDLDDLCLRLLRAFVNVEKQGGFFDSVVKSLSHLRPTLSVNSMTGDLSIGFDAAKGLDPQSITDILQLIHKHHGDKPLVVFLDEFQDILKIEDSARILSLMRGEVQLQGDLPYLFAGSVRNRMDSIFNSPDSPFFKSAIALNIGPLDQGDFNRFLLVKFAEGGRSVDPAIFAAITTLAEGVTGDVQQLCEALWSVSDIGAKVDTKLLPRALKLIYSREQNGYEIILAGLTANYVNILKALSKLGGSQVATAEFVREAKVANASSVSKALSNMAERKIMFKAAAGWRFTNPFFAVWLREI